MTDTDTHYVTIAHTFGRRFLQLNATVVAASEGKHSVIVVANKSTWYEDILSGLRLFTKTTEPDGVLFTLPTGGSIKIQYGLPAKSSNIEVYTE